MDWYRETMCPYCQMGTGGNHQIGCPNTPSTANLSAANLTRRVTFMDDADIIREVSRLVGEMWKSGEIKDSFNGGLLVALTRKWREK